MLTYIRSHAYILTCLCYAVMLCSLCAIYTNVLYAMHTNVSNVTSYLYCIRHILFNYVGITYVVYLRRLLTSFTVFTYVSLVTLLDYLFDCFRILHSPHSHSTCLFSQSRMFVSFVQLRSLLRSLLLRSLEPSYYDVFLCALHVYIAALSPCT